MSLGVAQPRAGFAQSRPGAAFLAQLLAARSNLAPQRLNRRTGETEANSAYKSTEASDVRRVPMGWRKNLSA